MYLPYYWTIASTQTQPRFWPPSAFQHNEAGPFINMGHLCAGGYTGALFIFYESISCLH